MSQNKRKMAFTSFERELIKELVAEVAHIIESKKTDADYNRKKNEMWKVIAENFNSNPLCQEATHQQIKKLWLNMKAKARDAKSTERQRFHTGGGAYIPDMSHEDDAVLSIVPHIMPTIKVTKDSDGNPDIDGEDDNLGWIPIAKRPRMSSIDTPYVTTHPSTLRTVTTHTTTACITSKNTASMSSIDTPYVTTHPSTLRTVTTHTTTACITSKNTASPQPTTPYPGIPLIKIKRTAIKHPVTTHPVTSHTMTTLTANALPMVVHTPITHTVTTHTATAHTATTQPATITQPATATPTSSTAKPKPYAKTSYKTKPTSNIDVLKLELIQINIDHHRNKYEQDLAHQKNTNDLNYKILLLEYETKLLEQQHKIKIYNLIEAEQEAKSTFKLDED